MNSEKNEGFIAPVFVCTFCKEEFALMNSVFCHMNEMHELDLKIYKEIVIILHKYQ